MRAAAISLKQSAKQSSRTAASGRTQSVTTSSLVSHNRYRRSVRPEYAAMTAGAAVPVSDHQITGHRQPDCKARSREPRKVRQVSMKARRCLSVAERPAQSIPCVGIWNLLAKVAFWLPPAPAVCALRAQRSIWLPGRDKKRAGTTSRPLGLLDVCYEVSVMRRQPWSPCLGTAVHRLLQWSGGPCARERAGWVSSR